MDFLNINSSFFFNSLDKQDLYISDLLNNQKLVNSKSYSDINNKFIAHKFLRVFFNKLIIKFNIYINDTFLLLYKNIDNFYSLYLYYIDINRLYFLDNLSYLDYSSSFLLNNSSSSFSSFFNNYSII